MDPSEFILSLEDIHWKQKGKPILKDVTWKVKKGEHWVLLGLNGSGKTSILKMITGYQWPTEGTVSVLGNLFGKANIQELRKSIGWVSTSLDERFKNRSDDSALHVVLSGKHASIGTYTEFSKEDVERAKSLLSEFGIDHLYDQPFFTLSQGEKRKVMISRALMPFPKLLILDEPCNGLDLYSKEQLLASIEKMNQKPSGPTLLYVTHHIEEVLPSITHAMLLDSGSVIASGEKKDILTEEKIENTFHLPVSIKWDEERPWIRVKSNIF
ncbi:ABC transporter ATP-binding protein [Alteribacillus iranensis]|uniref:Iron complex transport system ATP-binding protein n=1 Tax=Alteribacillus iranensis TaxID=930128 RepID=A0A1I2DMV4_9BACI|nr:ABC transporter ATP-binding protein [Alteribacillus iranensis]SFE81603.1 iron complex transport system ATP-binding protein [Alteribacillus iranensis]